MQLYFYWILWLEKCDDLTIEKVHTLLHFWWQLWCNFKMEQISCQLMFCATMQFWDGANLLPDFVQKSVPYPLTSFLGPPVMQFQDGANLLPEFVSPGSRCSCLHFHFSPANKGAYFVWTSPIWKGMQLIMSSLCLPADRAWGFEQHFTLAESTTT